MSAPRRLRLLSFTTLFPNDAQPLHGLFVKARLDWIARHCDLTVVAPADLRATWRSIGKVPQEEKRGGIRVLHPRFVLPPGLWRHRGGAWLYGQVYPQIRRRLNGVEPELIDAHYAHPDGAAAARLAERLGKPMVLSVRGSDIQILTREPKRKLAIQNTLRRADAVIAVSRALKRLVEELGAEPEKVWVIPNGVDRELFFPEDRLEARRKVGWSPEDRVILWVGRLDPIKGLDLLVEAAVELRHRVAGTVLWKLVGGGPMRDSIRAMIRQRGLESEVTLEGGVPPAELRTWYSAADLFFLPSLSEGCPNVVLESLACGTPVVAMDIGGVPDLVREGKEGLLVRRRDAALAAARIAEALARTWDPCALAASRAVRGWSEVAEDQVSVYHQVLERTEAQPIRQVVR